MFVKRRLNRADNQPTSENDKKQMGLLRVVSDKTV